MSPHRTVYNEIYNVHVHVVFTVLYGSIYRVTNSRDFASQAMLFFLVYVEKIGESACMGMRLHATLSNLLLIYSLNQSYYVHCVINIDKEKHLMCVCMTLHVVSSVSCSLPLVYH